MSENKTNDINTRIAYVIWYERDEAKAMEMIRDNLKDICTVDMHAVKEDSDTTDVCRFYLGSIMHLAVRRNMPNVLRILIRIHKQQFFDVLLFSGLDGEDKTLMWWAVEIDSTDIVKVLCQENKILDEEDWYILHNVGNLEIAEILVLYHRDKLGYVLFLGEGCPHVHNLLIEYIRNPSETINRLEAKHYPEIWAANVFTLNLLIRDGFFVCK